jgi:hypothetical protein
MERDKKLESDLITSLASYAPRISWEKDAYMLETSYKNKRALVVWPYPLMEVFFDLWENNKKIFSESFEFYENETNEELVEYLVNILKNYFDHETRVETEGKLFKHQELQFKKGDEWVSVF